MHVAPSIGRASMALVLATVVIIDAADVLRTKVSALVFLIFLLAFVFESLVQTIGHWLTLAQRNRLTEDLTTDETAKGPLPPVMPEVPDVADPPVPEEPTPSISAPPKPEPDWERLSREPAYMRKHAVLAAHRQQRAPTGESHGQALHGIELAAAAAH